jgi:hypothetical protein
MIQILRIISSNWIGPALIFKVRWLTLLLLMSTICSYAQKDSAKKDFSIIAFPLVFSNPESGFGAGAGGLASFKWGNDTLTRESNLQLGGAYTSKEQILSYGFFQVFTSKNKQYFFGELGFYDFNYFFYGLGNETQLSNEEVFFFDLYRLRLTALQKIKPRHYLGLRWYFDYWQIKDIEEAGFLAQEQPLGLAGGPTSALGGVYLIDTRNDVFYPAKGTFLEFALLGQNALTGGNFSHGRLTSNLSWYQTLSSSTILATNFKNDWLWGEAGFFNLPQLGGLNNLRGYYLGRFRGNFMQLLQTELRQAIYGRFKMAAFAGVGSVAYALADIPQNKLHLATGLGLRYKVLKNSKAHLRLDFAWGDGPMQVYVGIAEAF